MIIPRRYISWASYQDRLDLTRLDLARLWSHHQPASCVIVSHLNSSVDDDDDDEICLRKQQSNILIGFGGQTIEPTSERASWKLKLVGFTIINKLTSLPSSWLFHAKLDGRRQTQAADAQEEEKVIRRRRCRCRCRRLGWINFNFFSSLVCLPFGV